MAEPDQATWSRLCVGDPDALTAIYERYVDAVYNFAFRRTASWSLAEDAVQATFSTLWRRARAGGLPPLRLTSARPLLLKMAGHECSNLLRSQRRRARLLSRLRPSPDAADHAPGRRAARRRATDERSTPGHATPAAIAA